MCILASVRHFRTCSPLRVNLTHWKKGLVGVSDFAHLVHLGQAATALTIAFVDVCCMYDMAGVNTADTGAAAVCEICMQVVVWRSRTHPLNTTDVRQRPSMHRSRASDVVSVTLERSGRALAISTLPRAGVFDSFFSR